MTWKQRSIAATLALLPAVAQAQPVITTLAGNGSRFCSSSIVVGLPAILQCVGLVGASAVAPGGTMLVTGDWGAIRVDPTGVVVQVIHSAHGYGDVAADAEGNFFVIEQSRLQKVSPDGSITTVAGSGEGYCGDGGLAIDACLGMHGGVSIESGGVTVDGEGNIFIADFLNNRVRKIDSSSGIITTVAGNGLMSCDGDGGPATATCVGRPTDVAVDALGNLFITQFRSNSLRRVDTSGNISTSLLAFQPTGIATDLTENLFLTDSATHRVLRLDAAGLLTPYAGKGSRGFTGDGGVATLAKLNVPGRLNIDSQGNLMVADFQNDRIRKVDREVVLAFTQLGCPIKGSVAIGEPAPTGGATVTLDSDNPDANLPTSVRISAGNQSSVFRFTPNPVANREIVRTTAHHGSAVRAYAFMVEAPHPQKLEIVPNPSTPMTTTTGTVSLNCAPAIEDVVVSLKAAYPGGSVSVPPSVTVPKGAISVSFLVTIGSYGGRKATITATANGFSVSEILHIGFQ